MNAALTIGDSHKNPATVLEKLNTPIQRKTTVIIEKDGLYTSMTKITISFKHKQKGN